MLTQHQPEKPTMKGNWEQVTRHQISQKRLHFILKLTFTFSRGWWKPTASTGPGGSTVLCLASQHGHNRHSLPCLATTWETMRLWKQPSYDTTAVMSRHTGNDYSLWRIEKWSPIEGLMIFQQTSYQSDYNNARWRRMWLSSLLMSRTGIQCHTTFYCGYADASQPWLSKWDMVQMTVSGRGRLIAYILWGATTGTAVQYYASRWWLKLQI